MEDTMTDIFNIQSDVNKNDETIDFVPINKAPSKEQKIQKVPVKRKKDKILIVQVLLLIIWAILTAVVYFFGYDLLSPFINV